MHFILFHNFSTKVWQFKRMLIFPFFCKNCWTQNMSFCNWEKNCSRKCTGVYHLLPKSCSTSVIERITILRFIYTFSLNLNQLVFLIISDSDLILAKNYSTIQLVIMRDSWNRKPNLVWSDILPGDLHHNLKGGKWRRMKNRGSWTIKHETKSSYIERDEQIYVLALLCVSINYLCIIRNFLN